MGAQRFARRVPDFALCSFIRTLCGALNVALSGFGLIKSTGHKPAEDRRSIMVAFSTRGKGVGSALIQGNAPSLILLLVCRSAAPARFGLAAGANANRPEGAPPAPNQFFRAWARPT